MNITIQIKREQWLKVQSFLEDNRITYQIHTDKQQTSMAKLNREDFMPFAEPNELTAQFERGQIDSYACQQQAIAQRDTLSLSAVIDHCVINLKTMEIADFTISWVFPLLQEERVVILMETLLELWNSDSSQLKEQNAYVKSHHYQLCHLFCENDSNSQRIVETDGIPKEFLADEWITLKQKAEKILSRVEALDKAFSALE